MVRVRVSLTLTPTLALALALALAQVRMREPACAETRAEAMPVQQVEARDNGDGTYTLQWCAEVDRVRVSSP